jgi:hypothetical protein
VSIDLDIINKMNLPAPNVRFNHDLQLQIDSIEWALEKVEINKFPNDRLESVIRATLSV